VAKDHRQGSMEMLSGEIWSKTATARTKNETYIIFCSIKEEANFLTFRIISVINDPNR
jgi:hypothetical protein